MVFVRAEELTEELDIFGLSAGDEVLEEMQKICDRLGFNAESLVTKWVAFSHSCGNISLSLGRLSDFQLHLSQAAAKNASNKQSAKRLTTSASQIANSILADTQPDDDLMSCYSDNPTAAPPRTPRPLKTRQLQATTPNDKNILSSPAPSTPAALGSVSQLLGVASQGSAQKYSERSSSGTVIKEAGTLDVITPRVESVIVDCEFDPYPRFMMNDPSSQVHFLYTKLQTLSGAMHEHHNFDVSPLDTKSNEPITGFGRIVCDGNGKLNSKSILVQTSAGNYIPLDVERCPNFSLFPGQIVGIKATSPEGRLISTEIFPGILPRRVEMNVTCGGVLNIMSASGPFTPTDVFSLDPFTDFIHNVQKQKPDVLIIHGPFLDSRNERLLEMEEPFVTVYEGMLMTLSNLANEMKLPIIIIPSTREIFHLSAYPIQPYPSPKFDLSKFIHLLPDPCFFSINGIVFGSTSTDIIFHLSFEEISRQSGKSIDRISRLVSHLFLQQSFYPLYPPHIDVPLDHELQSSYGQIPVMPHFMLLPSELSPFVKTVDSSVVVNPGYLMKGQSGGAYMSLSVNCEKVSGQTTVPDFAYSCKVVKI